jgi:octaprenyl-diphosphate synthase
MVAQIANDIRGISTGKDIRKKKITLPILYALTHLKGTAYKRLKNMIFKHKYLFDPVQIKESLFQSGAIYYASIKMELYKQKALDLLNEVEKAHIDTDRLKLFLE